MRGGRGGGTCMCLSVNTSAGNGDVGLTPLDTGADDSEDFLGSSGTTSNGGGTVGDMGLGLNGGISSTIDFFCKVLGTAYSGSLLMGSISV